VKLKAFEEERAKNDALPRHDWFSEFALGPSWCKRCGRQWYAAIENDPCRPLTKVAT
jgi:hypothetical protein